MRIIGVLALIALLPISGAAQRLSSPSPHYGAGSIPNDQVNAHWELSFDRFTPNGKATDPGLYNAIDRTIGLNFVNYSFSAASARWPGVIYRGTVQLGYGHDQPTETLQRRLHIAVDSLPIESINPRNNVIDAVLNLQTDHWAAVGANAQVFGGAGFALGTPNQDVWLHAGGRLFGGGGWPSVSSVVRVGFPFGGSAFPDSTLTDAYGAVQVAVRLPVNTWLGG